MFTLGFQSLFWWKYCPGGRHADVDRVECAGFNPCSGGSIALGFLGVGQHGGMTVFQSLFWWKYCPGVSVIVLDFSSTCSFNPCSGGSIALGPEAARLLFLATDCFNPCSGGSIALGPEAARLLFLATDCFNPCSGGSIALGSEPIRTHRPRGRVSILVLVEVLPWGPPACARNNRRSRFQSLFWWKYCPGFDVVVSRNQIALIQFQSLFWWKYCPGHCRLRRPGTPRGETGFNPCSGGSIALGSQGSNSVTVPGPEFQSLFWWKYCPGADHASRSSCEGGFQSLFWWKYCPGLSSPAPA